MLREVGTARSRCLFLSLSLSLSDHHDPTSESKADNLERGIGVSLASQTKVNGWICAHQTGCSLFLSLSPPLFWLPESALWTLASRGSSTVTPRVIRVCDESDAMRCDTSVVQQCMRNQSCTHTRTAGRRERVHCRADGLVGISMNGNRWMEPCVQSGCNVGHCASQQQNNPRSQSQFQLLLIVVVVVVVVVVVDRRRGLMCSEGHECSEALWWRVDHGWRG